MRSCHRVERAKIERPSVKRNRAAGDRFMRPGADREQIDDGRKFGLERNRAHEMPQQIPFRLDLTEGRRPHT